MIDLAEMATCGNCSTDIERNGPDGRWVHWHSGGMPCSGGATVATPEGANP